MRSDEPRIIVHRRDYSIGANKGTEIGICLARNDSDQDRILLERDWRVENIRVLDFNTTMILRHELSDRSI